MSNPRYTAIWGWDLGRCCVIRVTIKNISSSWIQLKTFKKRCKSCPSVSLYSARKGFKDKMVISKPGHMLSPEMSSVSILIVDFQALSLWHWLKHSEVFELHSSNPILYSAVTIREVTLDSVLAFFIVKNYSRWVLDDILAIIIVNVILDGHWILYWQLLW